MNYKITIEMCFSDDKEKTMYGSEIVSRETLLKCQEAIEKLTSTKVDLYYREYETPDDQEDDDFLRELLLDEGLIVEETEEALDWFGYSLLDVLIDYYGWEAVEKTSFYDIRLTSEI